MDQEYTFIVLESMRDALAPYVYGPCTLECVPTSRLSSLKSALRRITPLRFLRKKLRRGTAQVPKAQKWVCGIQKLRPYSFSDSSRLPNKSTDDISAVGPPASALSTILPQ